jgi:hypothetical protein
MLVALRGRVESKDPKTCELSDRKAVIHEVRKPDIGSLCANKSKSHAQYSQPAQKVSGALPLVWRSCNPTSCQLLVSHGIQVFATLLVVFYAAVATLIIKWRTAGVDKQC